MTIRPHNGQNAYSKISAGILSALALGGCAAEGPSPEQAELNNMWRFNMVPKSSAAQLVGAFDRFCVKGSPARLDADLRTAGYVPLVEDDDVRSYVVDDRRPAVGFSNSLCVVRAQSRSGQNARFRDYVNTNFPNARPVDPSSLGNTIEEAWEVQTPGAAVIATERAQQIDGATSYSLIYYRAKSG